MPGAAIFYGNTAVCSGNLKKEKKKYQISSHSVHFSSILAGFWQLVCLFVPRMLSRH